MHVSMSMRVFNFIHSFSQTETAHSSGRNSYSEVERARVVIAVSYRSKSIDNTLLLSHCICVFCIYEYVIIGYRPIRRDLAARFTPRSVSYIRISIILNLSAHRHSSHCDTYSFAQL